MFGRKRLSDKIDYEKLNDLIRYALNFMKLIFGVAIVALIVLITYIGKEWNIVNFLKDVISILSPFFIGVILAWLLDPIVTFLHKKGVKRGLGVTFIYVIILGILVIIGNILAPSLVHQLNEIVSAMPELISSISNTLDNFVIRLANTYNLDAATLENTVSEVITNLFYSFTVDGPTTIISVIKSIISGGVNVVIGFLIGFYMLLDFDGVRKHLSNMVPSRHKEETSKLMEKLNNTLRRYVYGTLIVMFILFICQSIGMTIAGMKAPLVFGLFCAVTNIIPYLGPYIGGIPSVIIAFTISPSVGIGVLISVVVCQLLESYILTPTVMSKTMKLHPVTIILGLLIFGHFFGILGMLFATPVVACLKIIAKFFMNKYGYLKEETE